MVKYTPNATVMINPTVVWLKSPTISAWCAQVTLTPEDTRMIVFNKGTPKGLKGITPAGGHTEPTSTLGANLA